MRYLLKTLTLILLVLLSAHPARAEYVLPQLGGGQVAAPMKHADITLVGNELVVHIDPTVPTPTLRSLLEPDIFNPAMPWGVLNEKAHNFQYGWNPSGFWAPPAGAGIWMEEIAASPELETYFVDGLPVSPPYTPIFGTNGSDTKWQWSGSMTHNAYAVRNPQLSSYQATYKVYLGDSVTGVEITGYESSEITFLFSAVPILSADFNSDFKVNALDLAVWQQNYAKQQGISAASGDSDGDTDVDGIDFLNWQRQFTGSDTLVAVAVAIPEPTAAILLIIGGGLLACRMPRLS